MLTAAGTRRSPRVARGLPPRSRGSIGHRIRGEFSPARWAEPEVLLDHELQNAIVGWHVYEDSRSQVLLFIGMDSDLFEVCTAGDGSLRLARCDGPPTDYDMAELGRFEFLPVATDHPWAAKISHRLTAVRRARWRDTTVGVLVDTTGGLIVLANNADDVWVSDGELPPDYAGAVIED